MFQKTQLSNGMTVVTVPMPQVKSATVMLLVDAGSRHENAKNNGISHFLEHMAFKGTVTRPNKLAVATVFDSIGASFNAFTGKEYTGYFAKAASDKVELMMDIISDIILHSTYDSEEIEREKGVIIEEINGSEDDPLGRSMELLEEMMFANSPLSRRITGEKETVSSFTRDDVVSYVSDMYHGDSMILVVAGNVTRSQVEDLAEKFWKSVKKGTINQKETFTSFQERPMVRIKNKKTDQAHFCLGVEGVSRVDKNRYPLALLGTILGGLMSSRLFIRVRDQMGLAYTVGAGAEEYFDTGIFLSYASTKIEKTSDAIKAILEEMRRFTEEEVTDEELRRAKDNAKGHLVLALEDSYKVAKFFGSQELLEKKMALPEEKLAELETVTKEDIKNCAKAVFLDQKLNLALVGPFKETASFERILKS